MKISATIITYNEERNIARAIESLRCADEIIVVDSGSSDRTMEIAEKLGARVIERNWVGYSDQKNWAADQASHDWILSLDADEAVSEMLEAEIWQLKKNGPSAEAYTMPRLAQYLGKWILHSGWHPDRKTRLYHRRKAKWVGSYVHEGLEVSGKIQELEGSLLHFTCQSLSEHLRTMDRYTTLAAEQLVEQKAKISLWKLFFKPWWEFNRTYFLKRGFLDGAEGMAIAWTGALYVFLKYAKARFMLPGR
ncbi:MAG: glycosyltransferase family 2 protein [Acidobacteria bacterium]|nr:glycosyltransferase family 2 protein [Acidobacteriota bacterium]